MNENGLDIETISTVRTDKQTDRVLLFREVKFEKDKALPSHFLKFLCQPAFGKFTKPHKPPHKPSFAIEPNHPPIPRIIITLYLII